MNDARSRPRRTPRPLLPLLLLLGVLLSACQVPDPEIPSAVVKESRPVLLAGKTVTVDFYTPKDAAKAPVIVVAHGFSRNRRYMAGWGVLLAKNGFTAAVLDQPAWSDHARNGRAIAELLRRIQSGSIPLKTAPDGRAGLVGMSMGGLTTILAAAETPVDAWVGLDPVDGPGGAGAKAAASLRMPAAVLLAEPSAWNARGNARTLIGAFPSPPFALKVRGASHCDTESPTDLPGSLATGGTNPKRLATFEHYLIAFLKTVFAKDPEAQRQLDGAKQDTRVSVIEH